MPHRSVFEKGLLDAAIFKEVDVPDNEGRRLARELDVFDVCVVEVFARSLGAAHEDVLCDLDEAADDVRLEQL